EKKFLLYIILQANNLKPLDVPTAIYKSHNDYTTAGHNFLVTVEHLTYERGESGTTKTVRILEYGTRETLFHTNYYIDRKKSQVNAS
ncbi:hypothetical protein ACJX0J_009178, partial [Zea mays]